MSLPTMSFPTISTAHEALISCKKNRTC